MVAVVTGTGLGLERSSGLLLGSRGQLGSSGLGRYGEQVTVNAATGNLVIQRTDEILIGRGVDDVISRNYNSLGADADNGDNWQLNAQRRIVGAYGDATITRIDWDGSNTVYTWDQSLNGGLGGYLSKQGTGAYDLLTFASNVWTWTDGDTQLVEKYDAANNGRITSSKDTDGNGLTFTYTSGHLTRVATSDGGYTDLTWSGDNITSVVTSYTRTGPEATYASQIYRIYDAAFDRAPTAAEYDSAINAMLNGQTLDQLADQIYATAEYQGRGVAAMSNGDYVDFLFQSVLRRAPTTAEHDSNVALLTGGTTRAALLRSISESAEHVSLLTTTITGRTPPTRSTTTRVSYSYDAQNRLSTVTTDLSPVGNVAGSDTVVTRYTYDGNSNRVATISQTGSAMAGTNAIPQLQIVYDSSNRVSSYTLTTASGQTRTTGFDYSTPGVTRITDPDGQVTKMSFDGNGQLTKLELPPAQTGLAAQTYSYVYNANGDLLTVQDAISLADVAGNKYLVTYDYDANGNLIFSRDEAGNVVTRTYGSKNELLTETRYVVADKDGSGTAYGPEQPVTTRYAYDAKNHLRYVVSAQGEVTEYQYNTLGQQIASIIYRNDIKDLSGLTATDTLSETDLTTWVATLGDLDTVERTNTTYDFRGNVSTVSYFGSATETGDGAPPTTKITYVYDQFGNLLTRLTTGMTNTEVFTYDGLGRLVGSVDLNGTKTVTSYTDGQNKAVVTLSNGFVQTMLYNALGELLSYAESGTGFTTGTASYKYDALGNLRVSTDATARKTYYLYDALGRKVADVAADGAITEYVYDVRDRLVRTIRYATKIDVGALVDASGNPLDVDLATVRPGTAAGDQWEWRIYDKADRLTEVIDGAGGATVFAYDGLSNLISTTQYYTKLNVSSYAATPPTTLKLPTANAKDSVTRAFYDKDGRQGGTLDGAGYLSRIVYNGAGEKIQTIAYANLTDASLRAAGTFDQLVASVGTSDRDISTYYAYDGRGLLRYVLGADLHPIEYVYDTAGHRTSEIVYGGDAIATGNTTLATIQSEITRLGLGSKVDTRKSYAVYDPATGTLAYSVDAAGGVVAYGYDAQGRVNKQTAFATTNTVTALPTKAALDTWASPATGTKPIDHVDNRVTRTVYDLAGRVAYTVDPESYVTEYRYDSEDRLTLRVRYGDAYSVGDAVTQASLKGQLPPTIPTAAVQEAFSYDPLGRLSTSTNGEGIVTRLTYDALDRVIYSTVADGTTDAVTTRTEYDAAGNVSRVTVGYDIAGGVNLAEASTTSYTYDGMGNVLTVKDGNANAAGTSYTSTTYTYDAMGRVLSTSVAIDASTTNNAVTSTDYDAFGNLIRKQDPRGNVTVYAYDKLNRLSWQVDAEGYATSTSYTVGGEVASVTHYATPVTGAQPAVVPTPTLNAAKDATTTFLRDKLGRVTKVTDAEGYYEQYTLSAFGDRLTVRNKLGGVTSNVFDHRGLLTSETLPMNAVRADGSVQATSVTNSYSYDARGNRKTMVEAAGLSEQRTTLYDYDKLDRLTKVTHDAVTVSTTAGTGIANSTGATQTFGNSTTTATPSESYSYDRRGNLILQVDAGGAKTFFYYDALDRKTAQVDGAGTLSGWTYDANGNVLSATIYGTAVTLPSTPGGTPPAGDGGNYRVTSYLYDRANRMTSATATGRTTVGGVVIDGLTTGTFGSTYAVTTGTTITTSIAYDKAGNIRSQTDANGGVTTFYYDRLGRKIAQVDPEKYYTLYTLDGDGNVTREERSAYKLVTVPADVSGLYANRIAYANFVSGSTGWTISYNDQNIVTNGPLTGTYDGKNFLKAEFNATGVHQGVSLATDWGQSWSVTSGERLSVQVGVEATGPTDWTSLAIWWMDANGNVLSGTNVDGKTGQLGYDTKLSGFATVPPGAVKARLEIYTWTSGAGTGSLAITEPMVTQAPADANRVDHSNFADGSQDWVIGYDPSGIVQAGPSMGSANGSNYLKVDFNATAAGQPASIATGPWWPAKGGERLYVQAGVEGTGAVGRLTLTVYCRNAAGISTRFDIGVLNGPQGYNTPISGWITVPVGTVDARLELYMDSSGAGSGSFSITQPSVSLSTSGATARPAFAAGSATGVVPDASRITTFTYDRNGRRLSETRAGVVASLVDGNGALTTASGSSTILYGYNGLGEVTRKTEATGDYTDYAYDLSGRQTSVTTSAFASYTGPDVQQKTGNYYDGLNNLVRTTINTATATSGDRVTTYSYGAGGRLASTTDASGFTRSYVYDVAGRVVRESWTRLKADGTTALTEANILNYDILGRVTLQSVATLSGSSWSLGDRNRVQYNAYGEVAARGTNGLWQQSYAYDNAGRIWRSTDGDGLAKLFVYDKNGNQSLAITSSGTDLSGDTLADGIARLTNNGANLVGAVAVSGVVATISAYDKRGQLTQIREPLRETSATTTTSSNTYSATTYNAFGEVTSQRNQLGAVTNYSYNTMGRLVRTELPAISYTDTTGLVRTGVRPTQDNYYDISGRLVGVKDANGNVNTRSLLANTGYGDDEALVRKEYHADGGVFENKYDVFGDLRTAINEIGKTESYVYDAMGRLIEQDHQQRADGTQLKDYYAYDGLGQRTQHWNSQLGSSVKETTDYDVQGRVAKYVDFIGDDTKYSYVWSASLATPLTSGTLGTFGGWTKTTVNAANKTMTETSDLFGRSLAKADYGGHVYSYSYDVAGRLVRATNTLSAAEQTATGAAAGDVRYDYYNSGRIASITGGSDSSGGVFTAATVASYKYDAAGRRTYEGYTVNGAVRQAATVTWDAAGRMTKFTDTGFTGERDTATILYEYDLVGNVRHMNATYYKLDDQGVFSTTTATQDYWYLYDSMNRFTVTKGGLWNLGSGASYGQSGDAVRGSGTIIGGLEGAEISYDAAGQRQSASYTRTKQESNGFSVITFVYKEKENYSYTADGYLSGVSVGQGTASVYYLVPRAQDPTGSGTQRASYARDALGRVTDYKEYGVNGTSVVYRRQSTYDVAGRVTGTTDTSVIGTDSYVSVSTTSYGNGGNYQGGAPAGSSTTNYKNGVEQSDANTVYSYVWWDSAVQAKTVINTHGMGIGYRQTVYGYDALGHLTTASIADDRPRTVTFVTDANGQVLQRDEEDGNTGTGDPRAVYYYFNGLRVGDISNNGTSDVDYATSIARHTTSSDPLAPFSNGYQQYADFDQSYDPINGLNYEGAASRYTVQDGDTLPSIAAQLWGDASLWYMIADANGLDGSETLAAGRSLIIPNKIHNVHNNSDTYRVYDPNEAIGNTLPTAVAAPKPPKKNKCGVFGQILSVIVSVVATHFLGPIFGNLVSQGFNNLIGIQHGFSWKSLATSVLTYELTPGATGNFLTDVVNGAVANATVQGIEIATGLQHKFDWAGVAAAGVSAGVGGQFRGSGSAKAFGGKLGAQIAGSTAASIAGSAAYSLISGDDFGDTLLSTLPTIIGQAAGMGLADKLDPNARGGLFGVLGDGGAIGRAIDTPFTFARNVIGSLGEVVSNTVGNLAADGIASIGAPKVADPRLGYDPNVFEGDDGVVGGAPSQVADAVGPGVGSKPQLSSYDLKIIQNQKGADTKYGPFLIQGGTAAQRAELAAELKQIEGTKRGEKFFDSARSTERQERILIADRLTGSAAYADNDRGIVYIDFKAANEVQFETTKGWQKGQRVIVLAHELGHIYSNVSDSYSNISGRQRMLNVDLNENPIRKELGYAPRVQYDARQIRIDQPGGPGVYELDADGYPIRRVSGMPKITIGK